MVVPYYAANYPQKGHAIDKECPQISQTSAFSIQGWYHAIMMGMTALMPILVCKRFTYSCI